MDRPRSVMVTNVPLNTFMVTWNDVCDNISPVDKSSVTGYIISWYNLTRDLLDDLFVPSSCKDSETEPHYITNFISNLSVQFVSVSAENVCGRGEATNIVVAGMLFLASINCVIIRTMSLSDYGHCKALLDISQAI